MCSTRFVVGSRSIVSSPWDRFVDGMRVYTIVVGLMVVLSDSDGYLELEGIV